MSRGVNKVILVGNLGQDPDLRYGPTNGSAVCSASLATNETWKDRATGEKHERTEWHRLVFFGRLAEISAEHLRKGSQVYVEGRLRSRKWVDNSGAERHQTEIVVSEMQMLGGRPEGFTRHDEQQPSHNTEEGDRPDAAQQQHGNVAAPPQFSTRRPERSSPRGFSEQAPAESLEDDDIPF